MFYGSGHPLAMRLIQDAIETPLTAGCLKLDYCSHGSVISMLEPLRGQVGVLELAKLSVQSMGQHEVLVFAGCSRSGEPLDDEQCRKLMQLPATWEPADACPEVTPGLEKLRQVQTDQWCQKIAARNDALLEEKSAKLHRWSEDLKIGLESKLKDLDQEIRTLWQQSRKAESLQAKLAIQTEIKNLDKKRKQMRQQSFAEQDRIDLHREALIDGMQQQLSQTRNVEIVFRVAWELV